MLDRFDLRLFRSLKFSLVFFSIVALVIIALNVLIVFLGIYAYGNPDPLHCYYVKGVDTTAVDKNSALILAEDRAIPVEPGYPIDIAHLFRSWFLWGFWGFIF